jgi:hypothetical protein
MSIIRSVRLQITAYGMVSCCSGGLAVRRAAAANPPLQQDIIPYAVICSITLLMMDIILSETC